MFRVYQYNNKEKVSEKDFMDITMAINYVTATITDIALHDMFKVTVEFFIMEPVTQTGVRYFKVKGGN